MSFLLLQFILLFSTIFLHSTISEIIIEKSTNEIELNKFLPILINSCPSTNHVVLLELDNDIQGVNFQKLSNIFQENNKQISMYISAKKWIEDLNKISFKTHDLKLVLGRFETLKTFLKIIWDKTIISYNQKYIFITDTKSFNQLIKLKEINDVLNVLILTIDDVLNTGFFYLYTSDPINDGEYILLGAWITHFIKTSDEIFPNKFSDLKGKVLTCTYMPLFPYTFEEKLHPKSLDLKVRGVDHDILSHIKKKLNFNVRYIKSIDDKYGVKNKTNGQFNGMIGMAQRQEVDICIGGILQSYEREKVIDFSKGILFDTTTFITRKPVPLSKWKAIFSPFHTSLWIALALGMLSYFVINVLYIRCTTIQIKKVTLTYSFLNIWASFMNQGIKHPKRSSHRILLAAWFLFSLCIVLSYAGSLFSSLTIPKYEAEINSPDQLLDSNLKIIVLKGQYHDDFFKHSSVKLYQRVYERSNKVPNVCTSLNDCLSFMNENTGYSFVFEKDVLISLIFTNSGGLIKTRVAKHGLYEIQYSTVFRKNSPIKHEYDKYLLKIQRAGLITFWSKRHLHKKRLDNLRVHSLDEKKETNKSLSMEHLQGIFLVYTLGMGCSLLAYLYERKKMGI